MGDFNADMENISLKHCCDLNNLKNLIKVPTCFKNPENPKCIDLMLTSSYRSFQNSCAIETGLSDFHKMIVTVMKEYFQKQKPKVITYRDYKNFSENDYRQQITYELSLIGHANEIPFDVFMTTCKKTLDKAAPVKQKYVRSNQSPFLNKQILKAIMNRTKAIKAIKERSINKVFKFQSVLRSDIKKEILSLDSSEASQESDIPTKIIKQKVDIFTEHLFHEFEK